MDHEKEAAVTGESKMDSSYVPRHLQYMLEQFNESQKQSGLFHNLRRSIAQGRKVTVSDAVPALIFGLTVPTIDVAMLTGRAAPTLIAAMVGAVVAITWALSRVSRQTEPASAEVRRSLRKLNVETPSTTRRE